MPIVDLTDRFCINAKATTRTDYYDAKARGLCLRVTPNGVKTFTLVFSTPEGKRARATLGRYPGMTLARARALAIEGHGQAFEGKDPRGDITASVAALIHGYLAKHVRPNLRSAKTTELRFKRSVLPVIGARPLEGLHKRDINRVLDPILARGCQVEAARCFEDLRALFRWGVQRGDLDHSPMDGMRKPITPGPRERVLSDDELRKLWRSLPDALARSRACQLIIKLCILTGQRVGEIAGMTRDELDLKARVWNIPGRRSKNGHRSIIRRGHCHYQRCAGRSLSISRLRLQFPIGARGRAHHTSCASTLRPGAMDCARSSPNVRDGNGKTRRSPYRYRSRYQSPLRHQGWRDAGCLCAAHLRIRGSHGSLHVGG
jgi:integrase